MLQLVHNFSPRRGSSGSRSPKERAVKTSSNFVKIYQQNLERRKKKILDSSFEKNTKPQKNKGSPGPVIQLAETLSSAAVLPSILHQVPEFAPRV